MATVEQSGFLKYKDSAGNTYLVLPITTKDNVDGIDEIEAELAYVKTIATTLSLKASDDGAGNVTLSITHDIPGASGGAD